MTTTKLPKSAVTALTYITAEGHAFKHKTHDAPYTLTGLKALETRGLIETGQHTFTVSAFSPELGKRVDVTHTADVWVLSEAGKAL